MPKYLCINENGSYNKYRVLLVFPKTGADAPQAMHIPASLLSLANHLRDFSVAIFDERVHSAQEYEKLLMETPLLVGFSTFTGIQIRNARDLAAKAKEKGLLTCFGGIHPTILPEQTLLDSLVDFVVAGEGELALRELLLSIIHKRFPANVLRGELPDLNAMPTLPYEHIDIEQYMGLQFLNGRTLSMSLSRGCPYSCTFCCNPVLSKKRWRHINVDVALKHVHSFIDAFKLKGIFFLDENLPSKSSFMHALAQGIAGKCEWIFQSRADSLLKCDLKLLSDSGARIASCGVESGSPRILELIRKQETVEQFLMTNRNLAENGIAGLYNYILGYPTETVHDIKMTVDLALQLLDENPYAQNNTFYTLSPYPGTEIAKTINSTFIPTEFAEWANFDRHNTLAMRFDKERQILLHRITLSSKFVGKKLQKWFAGDEELKRLTEEFTQRWREFAFFDDDNWKLLEEKSWSVLKSIFGKNAY